MIKWKTKSKEIALKSDFMTIISADVEMPNGESAQYLYADSRGTVIIIPVKPGTDIASHKYVMVRQYRYPVGSYDLEFPAGRREPGEAALDAARRELKQETGYEAVDIRIVYSMYSHPGDNNGTTHICVASLPPEPQERNLDVQEEQAGLVVEELTAEELHKRILSMDISDPHTLAAMCVFVMNSKTATQYLSGTSEEV